MSVRVVIYCPIASCCVLAGDCTASGSRGRKKSVVPKHQSGARRPVIWALGITLVLWSLIFVGILAIVGRQTTERMLDT